MMDF
jgi:hypothetical protein